MIWYTIFEMILLKLFFSSVYKIPRTKPGTSDSSVFYTVYIVIWFYCRIYIVTWFLLFTVTLTRTLPKIVLYIVTVCSHKYVFVYSVFTVT